MTRKQKTVTIEPLPPSNIAEVFAWYDMFVKFQRLKINWKYEKRIRSSMTTIERSEHYRQIIDMGEQVAPLIFNELRNDPDWWFAALSEILCVNPVPENERGNLQLMTQRWLSWEKENHERLPKYPQV